MCTSCGQRAAAARRGLTATGASRWQVRYPASDPGGERREDQPDEATARMVAARTPGAIAAPVETSGPVYAP